MKSMLASLAIASGLLFGAAQKVGAEPSDGSVDGQVTNTTSEGAAPVGDTIRLLVFSKTDQSLKDQLIAQVDAQSRYGFGGLDRDPDRTYLVVAERSGVTYPAPEPISLDGEAAAHVDLTVFDTTVSDESIRFERLNLLVSGADSGVVHMYEMGSVVNSGDRTLVSESPPAGALARGLHLALPAGAISAQMQTGFRTADLQPAAGGVQVTSPIKPGRHEFALSFVVPYAGTGADLQLQPQYPTDTYNVYTPEAGPRLESGQLTPLGKANLGGDSFLLATADNVGGSTLVSARLADLPSNTGEPSQLQISLSLAGVLLLVAGLGALAYSAWSARSRLRTSARRATIAPSHLERQRQKLVCRMASLDEHFEAGLVTASDYRNEREAGKRRLVELTRALRTAEPATSSGGRAKPPRSETRVGL